MQVKNVGVSKMQDLEKLCILMQMGQNRMEIKYDIKVRK